MKKLAFTMAEVLVTLGVIGIVAAMTLPTVINNAHDKQIRTKYKKQFSIISQAFQMVYLEDGEEIQFEDWREMQNYVCKIGQKLNTKQSGLRCDEVLSDFDPNKSYACGDRRFYWHEDETWYNAQKLPLKSNSAYIYMTFYLPDGAWINFNCSRYVFVDVNGAKRPNTVGRDIFYFVIPHGSTSPNFFDKEPHGTYANGCVGNGYGVELTPDNYQDDCLNGTGWGCSPLYILD